MTASLWDELRSHRLVFLSTPFTNFHYGHEAAFIEASRLAGKLIYQGVKVFSPIAHSYPMCEFGGIDPVNHDLWMNVNEPFLDRSDALIVGMLDGWRESKGVTHEIEYNRDRGAPVYFLEPETMALSNGAG